MKKLRKPYWVIGKNIFMRFIKPMLMLSICLFSILINSHANTIYQNNTYTIKVKGVAIESVMDKIEKETGYYFLFTDKSVNVSQKIDMDISTRDISELLDRLFSGTNIAYKIVEKQIVLSKKTDLPQQENKYKLQGTVIDESGEPIIGANVLVKNSLNGVVSDLNGNFSIEVGENTILQISYIGFISQEIAVRNREVLHIQLKENSALLEEVVIVGYGQQKKVNLTGAITSIKTEDLENIPSSNLSNTLAGRAPGVTVTNSSGMAGASSTIRMRGSFNEPLFVINNVIKSKQDFDALDPNEVENISFLKDAASASIYGSKAGNGVVLVTTRSGKVQRPEFQYKATVSTSRTTRPIQSYTATDELIWGNRVAETINQPERYGPEIFEYFKDKNYDVNDYVWQNPFSQQHNISVNGGNEYISYYMMLGYHDEDGSYKKVNYKRYNFRSDITANISQRFKVNFILSGNQRDYNRFYFPYDEMENFNVPQFYRSTFNWTKLYPFYVDDAGNPTTDIHANPVAFSAWHPVEMVIGNHYQKLTKRTMDGQLRFDLDLGQYIDGLSTSIFGQYTAYDDNQKAMNTYNQSYRFKSSSSTNLFIPGPIDPNDRIIHNLSTVYEGISEIVNLDKSYQLNWFLQYNKTFGQHAVSALAVYEQAEAQGKKLTGRADQLLTTSVDQIFATSSDTQRRYFNGNEWKTARKSYVGRLNYSFANKYILEFSFRHDGNYKFAPSERWGFFPSGSAAWRISEESFFKIPWVSNLKLRGSIGTTGDDNNWNGEDIAAFQWRESFVNGSGYVFGNGLNNGLKTGTTANPYISWAKLEVYDIGFEYGLFKNRLIGEFDYFYKNKKHILKERSRSIPGTYGATMSNENYAQQEWHGVETSVRWNDKYKNLNYAVYANLGYSKDKWLIMDEPEGLEAWRSIIGKPNNRLMGYIAEGIIRTQEELDRLPENFTQFGRTPKLGTILYRDIRGDNYSEGANGKIDSNDMTYLSDRGVPRINYGFGFNLEWKGIALDAHFQGVGAYDRFIRTDNGNGVFQVEEKPYFELWTGNNVWTPENPNAKYPRVGGAWQEEYGYAGSTFWLRNGAYVRLKNLNIAYTIPGKYYNQFGLKRMQLFLNGTNLFSISGMKEMDPEQHALDSYPIMRTFTAGLSINF